jgi:putative tricarboxylic transport membrane protein
LSGIEQFISGLLVALAPVNLFACLLGVLLGTLVGVLPGLGPAAAMSLMLPFSVKYGPLAGLIMLAGVWYGAMYGGSTTSILVNIPGEAASVVTCIDGYQMARRGRAGAALALVALGSWMAGTLGMAGLQFFAPVVGRAALYFGPPEYLALLVFSFVVLSTLVGQDQAKGVMMLTLGLFLGTIGIDPISGVPRFTFGPTVLMDGIDLVPVAVGLFGISEVLRLAGQPHGATQAARVRLRELYPNSHEARRAIGPTLRGSLIGFLCGLIPGPAPTISTFMSYGLEKRISPRRDEFGHGAVEGVVGPESANNAAVIGSLVPLLALGIPFSPPAAVMLAGLRLHNVNPGPLLFSQAPQMFWGFVASMYLANTVLLVLNLPLVGIFARIATTPPRILIPVVSVLCLVGGYSVRCSMFDVWVMIASGLAGYLFDRYGFPVAPVVIGLVLGPTAEANLRLTTQLLHGNPGEILHRPVVLAFLVLAVVFQVAAGRVGRTKKPMAATSKVEV